MLARRDEMRTDCESGQGPSGCALFNLGRTPMAAALGFLRVSSNLAFMCMHAGCCGCFQRDSPLIHSVFDGHGYGINVHFA